MVVLVICNNEELPIKNEGTRVFRTLYIYFSRSSRAANSAVLSLIWPNFELVQDVLDIFVTCKNEEDPFKNEGTRVVTRFSPLHTYGGYLTRVLIRSGPKPNAAFPPAQ